MKAIPALVLVSSLLVVAVVQAQIRVAPGVRAVAGDWHGFSIEKNGVYRYDSKTGTTKMLTWQSAVGSSKTTWVDVKEDKNALPATGDYEVFPGDTTNAIALRLERKSGRTWIMYGSTSGDRHWEATN